MMGYFILLYGLPFAIISLVLTLPSYLKERNIERVERSLPDLLSEVAESLRSGVALESTLKTLAETHKDKMGEELKQIMKDMHYHSLNDSLRRFAKRTGSEKIERIVSIINVASESDASLADVLDRISTDLWSGYMLAMERRSKTRSYAGMSLFGGCLLTPAIIGFIVSFFTGEELKAIEMGALLLDLAWFMCGLGFISALMYGAIVGKIRQALLASPLFVYISLSCYLLTVKFTPLIL